MVGRSATNRIATDFPVVVNELEQVSFPLSNPLATSVPGWYSTSNVVVMELSGTVCSAMVFPFNSNFTVLLRVYTCTCSFFPSWPGQVQLFNSSGKPQGAIASCMPVGMGR